tara:strand:- start:182 stop:670 length:489 start_codon:yes stop_codon:yes gene_type:complete
VIISCENCDKKFEISADLIPEKGRLLQCNSCNHKWFFINEVTPKFIEPIEDDGLKIFDTINNEKNNPLDFDKSTNIIDKDHILAEETINSASTKEVKNKKKYSIPRLIIVFIISFGALIILIDTFKYPMSYFVPNIEFLLYNLFESFKDISSFIKDLIYLYD